MRTRHAFPVAVLGLLTSVAVATGCGVSSNDTGPVHTTAASATTATTSTTTTTTRVKKPLPQRPSGVVAMDVLTGDAPTREALAAFNGRSDINVTARTTSDVTGFADLCAGRVDAISTIREPTDAELAQCKSTGVVLAAPIQVASDAIVLATKNGSDVGGDCMTVRQSRDVFKVGSQYTNWSQLGFFNLPLRTTGREQGSDGFRLFGQLVLGVPDPTIADVRADYSIRLSDKAERETVTSAAVRRQALKNINRHAKFLAASTKKARQDYIDKAVALANARALKVISAVNKENKRRKVIVNGPKLIADNARFVKRVKRAAEIRATRAWDRRLSAELSVFANRQLAASGQRGFIGPFRFSYYGLFEDQLRPMEIDYGVPETRSGQPVQFQDLTVADQQALQVRLNALGTTNGTAAGVTTSTAAATTSTAAATTTTTTGTTGSGTTASRTTTTKITVPPTTIVPPLDNLPKTTKDGQTIYSGPNCVFPSSLTITNGSYPLSRRLFVYTSKQALKRADTKAFLTGYVNGSQTLAIDNQLIPITDFQRASNIATINGTKQPTEAKQNGGEATITTSTTSTTPAFTTSTGTTTPSTTSTGTSTTSTTSTSTTPTLATPNPGNNSGIPGVSNRDPSSSQ